MIDAEDVDVKKYPQDRCQYFANKFIRHILKTRVANDLGAEAVLLLTLVVMTEDAVYYHPVSFWNSQLQESLGIRSEATLIKVRQKLIDAGLLHYSPGKKRQAGLYWVIAPPDLDVGGAPPTSSFPLNSTSKNEVKLQRNCSESKEKVKRKCGSSIPNPVPIPIPKEDPDGSCVATLTSATPAAPAVLVFPIVGKGQKEWPLTQDIVDGLQEAFLGVDVLAECRKALEWVKANRRKTAGGMYRFLYSWMSRANNHAPGKSAYALSPGERRNAMIYARNDDFKFGTTVSIGLSDEEIAASIPPDLNTPAFSAAWVRWVKYRESKTPISDQAAKVTFEQMRQLKARYGEQECLRLIERSIANDWQGLFSHDEIKPKPRRNDGIARHEGPPEFGSESIVLGDGTRICVKENGVDLMTQDEIAAAEKAHAG